MKSENIVLTVCLVFAISVITCLSVQSCKSHQFRRNIILEIDSINNKRMDSHNETDSIWQLMKKNNLYWEWTSEIYVPVMDSTGNVSGSILSGRETFKAKVENESGEEVSVRTKESMLESSSSGVKKKLDEEVQEKSKPDSPVNINFIVCIVVLFILSIIAVLIRKKTRHLL